MRPWFLLFVVACNHSSATSAPDATHPTGDASPIDSTQDAAANLSALIGVYSDSFMQLTQTVDAASGRNIAIENQRETWGTDFGGAEEAFDRANGIVPMISWAVAYKDANGNNTCASPSDIMNGVYDAELATEAQTIASWQTPVLIRFFKEFTDTADDACYYGTSSPASDPGMYGPMLVGAWQHVVDVFKQAGAANVQWVWGPSANLFGKTSPDDATWRSFYPGSNYVDWISNDNYDKSDTMLEDYGSDASIANWYALTLPLGKPLMQAETGAGYNAQLSPDPMSEWITTAYTAAKTEYPAMKAFLWWSATGEVDYNLQGAGLATYEAMAADPYFAATSVAPYFSSGGGGPAAPPGLGASATATAVTLAWTAPADPIAPVSGYDVYRNGVAIATTTTPSYVDSTVVAGTTYAYAVDAIDTVFDRSHMSTAIQVTTN